MQALVKTALVHVADLPEGEVLTLLREVADRYRRRDDAMQVDNTSAGLASDIPHLPEFLALCVSTPSSPSPLRVAMRDHLQPVECTVAVLQVIQGWIEASTSNGTFTDHPGQGDSGEKSDIQCPSLSKVNNSSSHA